MDVLSVRDIAFFDSIMPALAFIAVLLFFTAHGGCGCSWRVDSDFEFEFRAESSVYFSVDCLLLELEVVLVK